MSFESNSCTLQLPFS